MFFVATKTIKYKHYKQSENKYFPPAFMPVHKNKQTYTVLAINRKNPIIQN